MLKVRVAPFQLLPALPPARPPAGTQVAVKVRHPNVSEVIERDFGLMMSAAKVRNVHKWERAVIELNFWADGERSPPDIARCATAVQMNAVRGNCSLVGVFTAIWLAPLATAGCAATCPAMNQPPPPLLLLPLTCLQLAAQLPALHAFRLEESLKQFAAPLREQVRLACCCPSAAACWPRCPAGCNLDCSCCSTQLLLLLRAASKRTVALSGCCSVPACLWRCTPCQACSSCCTHAGGPGARGHPPPRLQLQLPQHGCAGDWATCSLLGLDSVADPAHCGRSLGKHRGMAGPPTP